LLTLVHMFKPHLSHLFNVNTVASPSSTWDEVTAVTVTYKALTPKLAARVGDHDVAEELAEFKQHDAKEFPAEVGIVQVEFFTLFPFLSVLLQYVVW
jgi:hypothetical protein